MEVKRIFSITGNVLIAGRLEELSPPQQKSIQKFIAQLDREKRRNKED